MIDYRNLLVRYMDRVLSEEGDACIGSSDSTWRIDGFTADESRELRRIMVEADRMDRGWPA